MRVQDFCVPLISICAKWVFIILEVQSGKNNVVFFHDTGTKNVIFMIKIPSELEKVGHNNLYLCFIDYTMVFV